VADHFEEVDPLESVSPEKEAAVRTRLIKDRDKDVSDVHRLLAGRLGMKYRPLDDALKPYGLTGILVVVNGGNLLGEILLERLPDGVRVDVARVEYVPGVIKVERRVEHVLRCQKLVVSLLCFLVRRAEQRLEFAINMHGYGASSRVHFSG
jgi:hypothetical protein